VVRDGTLFLRVGTTGGAGPTGGFQAGGPQIPLSAEILYFSPAIADGPAQLIAWDVIQQDAGSGDLTVERHVVASEFGALTPSPATPTTTPSGATPSGATPSGAAASSP
jgi:hypothetical protein